jgi:putative nucleotidyltransferase with HDIG domain
MVELAGQLREQTTWTWLHSGRVARYALLFGKKVGLDTETMFALQSAALLHDIGKISVPGELLDKSSSLTRDEWYTITKHSMASSLMLRTQEIPVQVISIAQSHHEWYNGKGYPLGLEGEAIPIGARLLSLADALDAMSSDRPYRQALAPAQIAEEFRKGAGAQFDPTLVEQVLPLLDVDLAASIPTRMLRVVSDDPMLFRELWFAAHPLGWELEAWPPGWVKDCPPELLRPAHMNGQPDLTVIDGRSIRRAPQDVMAGAPEPCLWVDPINEHEPAVYRPLDLRNMVHRFDFRLGAVPDAVQSAPPVRVVIADPFSLFRQVLRRCMSTHLDLDVVAEAESPAEFRKVHSTVDYDVAVVASDMLSGTLSTAPLRADDYHLQKDEAGISGTRRPLIVLMADEDTGSQMLGGASVLADDPFRVYIPRSAPSEVLVEAVKSLHDKCKQDRMENVR